MCAANKAATHVRRLLGGETVLHSHGPMFRWHTRSRLLQPTYRKIPGRHVFDPTSHVAFQKRPSIILYNMSLLVHAPVFLDMYRCCICRLSSDQLELNEIEFGQGRRDLFSFLIPLQLPIGVSAIKLSDVSFHNVQDVSCQFIGNETGGTPLVRG
jgi:hypothetical protein